VTTAGRRMPSARSAVATAVLVVDAFAPEARAMRSLSFRSKPPVSSELPLVQA
jgi:hypothetical protein